MEAEFTRQPIAARRYAATRAGRFPSPRAHTGIRCGIRLAAKFWMLRSFSMRSAFLNVVISGSAFFAPGSDRWLRYLQRNGTELHRLREQSVKDRNIQSRDPRRYTPVQRQAPRVGGLLQLPSAPGSPRWSNPIGTVSGKNHCQSVTDVLRPYKCSKCGAREAEVTIGWGVLGCNSRSQRERGPLILSGSL
jgi:hypothetical protein